MASTVTITFERDDGEQLTINNAEVTFDLAPITASIQIPGRDRPFTYSLGGMSRTLSISFTLPVDPNDSTADTIGKVFNKVINYFGEGNIGASYTITFNDWIVDDSGTPYQVEGVLKSVSISQRGGQLALNIKLTFYIGTVII